MIKTTFQSMPDDLPSWVLEYDEEYNKNNKNSKLLKIVGLGLIIISFLSMTISSFLENLYYLEYLSYIFIIIGTFLLIFSVRREKYIPKYLASMIYFIGYNLEKNSDKDSKIYVSQMDKHLKNCDKILKKINRSIFDSLYVKNTKDYIIKLNKLIKLLNEFYINYPEYDINKSDISIQIIQLADLIQSDNGCVTDEHFKLIDLLVTDLTKKDVNEKPLNIFIIERIRLKLKAFIDGTPYSFKLIAYIIFTMVISYHLIYYLCLSKGISQEIALGYAIAGAVGLLIPALMIKDYIIK